ncbi:MAG: hypothetical protein ACI8RZ_006691 [Myxococcota bacterium]
MLAVLIAAALAEDPADWGFSDHLAPLTLRDGEPLRIASEGCASCHHQQHADWFASRHRSAWTNDVYQTGYLVEQKNFCVYCHAPLAEQTAEVLANRAWYAAQHPRVNAELPEKKPEPHAAEGVSCATCHWREGSLVGPGNGEGAAHPVESDPGLRTSEFCAGCHEFFMPEGHAGTVSFTDVPMQHTFTEWQQWSARTGEDRTCQSCHMPDGRHLFRGAHDVAYLQSSVSVDAWRADGAVVFCLESVDVGHHLPTGDLFRHLTLEVDDGDGWRTIHRIGRAYEIAIDSKTGDISKQLSADTALRPGEPVEVTVPAANAWRLRYHYASAEDEVRGLLPREALIVTLLEGVLEEE